MKYFLYARKSTEEEERQALSLDSQLERARTAFSDLQIIELPPESASAFKPYNRPIFQQMIERIDAGEAHGIIAWHPDRLSRNEIDAAGITYRLRTQKLLDLKFGSYTFDNSPEGIMMLQMALTHSQYSSSKLSVDVKRGNERKLALGWKPGWAPTGYLNTPERDKGTKVIIKDEERFGLVRKAWDLILTGNYTVPEIMKIATEDWGLRTRKTRKIGGGPLCRSAWYGIFTNPFYAGLIRHNSETYNGSHRPMITLAEYDRVQAILGRKGKPRPKTHQITYRGPISCGECGCAITAEIKQKYLQTTGETKQYTYYHCTRKRPCSQRGSITEEEIERKTEAALSELTILPEFRDWALEALRENNDQEIEDRTAVHKNQTKALLSTQKQLDNLTKMRLKELITDEEYITQKEELTGELRSAKESVRDTEQRADKWLELTEQAFDFATTALDSFRCGNPETRRSIFITLGNSFTLKDKELTIQPCEWFVPIQKQYPQIERAFKEVRTNKKATSKELEMAYADIKSSWLRGLDSNQRPRR
ncbi:MAG: recombinase family protein [Candidatus Saccharimonadales bacterium]